MNANKIDFSVAMSVYKNDNPIHFKTAVESILNQTISPTEIVLIVDGEVFPDLDNEIKAFEKNKMFKVIRLPQNGGLGNALKIAVENAKYEIVARMDSDDIAVFNRFEQQIEYFLENPEVDIVGGDISEFIGEADNIVSKRCLPTDDASIKAYMKKRCPFNHMTVMYKKSAVLKAGNYMDLHFNEDYYLWVRMAEKGCVFANTGTILVNARSGEGLFKRRGGWSYFKPVKVLQKYMLSHDIIDRKTYFLNLIKRFLLHVLAPNWAREKLYKKLARK